RSYLREKRSAGGQILATSSAFTTLARCRKAAVTAKAPVRTGDDRLSSSSGRGRWSRGLTDRSGRCCTGSGRGFSSRLCTATETRGIRRRSRHGQPSCST
ncbi:unnamed protein product, partial [Ectocarpus fasciculatus]